MVAGTAARNILAQRRRGQTVRGPPNFELIRSSAPHGADGVRRAQDHAERVPSEIGAASIPLAVASDGLPVPAAMTGIDPRQTSDVMTSALAAAPFRAPRFV